MFCTYRVTIVVSVSECTTYGHSRRKFHSHPNVDELFMYSTGQNIIDIVKSVNLYDEL